jgi:hypothetical protein
MTACRVGFRDGGLVEFGVGLFERNVLLTLAERSFV